jgi:hypothetical protein
MKKRETLTGTLFWCLEKPKGTSEPIGKLFIIIWVLLNHVGKVTLGIIKHLANNRK